MNSTSKPAGHARRKPISRAASITLGILIGAISVNAPVSADDTEVFFGQVDPDTNVHPNVLFVLDTSGSMNSTDYGYSGTRMERMKSALNTILDSSSNVNVGLMRFNGYYGGGAIIHPITGIDSPVCPNNDCGSVSLTAQVRQNNDDMEQFVSSGQMTPSGNYLAMGQDGSSPQYVSYRFQDLDIPSGATITAATIEFTAVSTRTGTASLLIQGHDVDDAPTIATTNYYLTNLPRTTAEVDWNPAGWYIGNVYPSPDVSSIVQEIVNRTGWCGGQSMAFVVEGSGDRSAHAYNNSPSRAAVLRVSYDSDNIPVDRGCVERTALAQIDDSGDDAIERTSDGRIYTGSSDLDIPQSGSSNGSRNLVRLRFKDLSIPPGAVIQSASIEFEVDEQWGGNLTIALQAENVDDAPAIVADNYWISSRPVVADTVYWNISDAQSWWVNTKVSTPDLASQVQSLVNRPGWQMNNAMAFITRHSGSSSARRVFESYDGEQPAAAKLRVVYQADIGATGGAQTLFKTARDDLKQLVGELNAQGGTPIVAAYYEAVQYMLGGPVDYGHERGYYRHRFHRVSHPDSYTGGSVSVDYRCSPSNPDSSYCVNEVINGSAAYVSPLADSCQTNHIVFLSDGEATSNTAISKVKNLIGASTCSPDSGHEACGTELATWLNETDHNENMSRRQNISTYTIGFNINSSLLSDIAMAGGGIYYDAASAEELVAVFQNILGDVLALDTSFVAPGATVNQFNRLTHRNDIYFALFKPDQRPGWAGNLKRYHVGADSSGKVIIQDQNQNPAVDEDSGFFADTARSWWSDSVDGSSVVAGGAASKISLDGPGGSGVRRVFTYMGSSIPLQGVDLTTIAQSLHESNTAIDIAALSLGGGTTAANEQRRIDLLKWARGVDVQDEDLDGDTTDVRRHMGDPMHSQPVILNYANGGTTQSTIFVATNEGLLHALEHEYGTELFAYLPKELLPNLNDFYENQQSTRHPYGLDGDLSIWHDDVNENVMVDGGEKAYLYMGMRRGGNHYYALDISDRLNPRLLWQIDGGSPDFQQLGQTWSKPVPTKITLNGQERRVVIFAGGYDTNQDPNTANLQASQSTDSVGNAIYIVDAETGQRLWVGQGVSGGDTQFSSMAYSIPSDIRIIDVNADGLADQMYVGDMGGQVWRFDFQPFHQSGQLVHGGVIAKLNGSTAENSRRFYNEPDVALVAGNGQHFLSVSIGSGWRAHPLNEQVDDRFYMIRSNSVYTRPEGYGRNLGSASSPDWQPIEERDLVNVTDQLEPVLNEHGWLLALESSGEKVLSSSITINNQVIFTTYEPAATGDACSPAIGGGAIYVVDVLTGAPTINLDNSDVPQDDNSGTDGTGDSDSNQANYSRQNFSKTDRKQSLKQGGIPPSPTALITETNGQIGTTVLVSTEQLDVDFSNLTQRTYWQDNGRGKLSPDEISAQNGQ